jgi:hypothetical protein
LESSFDYPVQVANVLTALAGQIDAKTKNS